MVKFMTWRCICPEQWVHAIGTPQTYFSGLDAGQRQDLADLLPYLACGEVSAVYAFSGRLKNSVPELAQSLLQQIAADERRHADLLIAMQAKLPSPRWPIEPTHLAMFFQRLAANDPAEHLARVSALDRAVCLLLQPLLKKGNVISRAPQLHRDLCALRRDEARHVRLTRCMASDLGCSAHHQHTLNVSIQQRLLVLMSPVMDVLSRMGRA